MNGEDFQRPPRTLLLRAGKDISATEWEDHDMYATAARTNGHKLRGLNNITLSSYSPGGQKSKMHLTDLKSKGRQGSVPSWGALEEDPFSCFLQLSGVACDPWLRCPSVFTARNGPRRISHYAVSLTLNRCLPFPHFNCLYNYIAQSKITSLF